MGARHGNESAQILASGSFLGIHSFPYPLLFAPHAGAPPAFVLASISSLPALGRQTVPHPASIHVSRDRWVVRVSDNLVS